MAEAREIAGISVPFVAGVAAGAFLCPFLSAGLAVFADCILLLILLFTLITLARGASAGPASRYPGGGGKHAWRLGSLPKQHLRIAGIFLLTGIFCSLNRTMAGRIPEYHDAGLIATAASNAVRRLKDTIDSIPYPSQSTAPLIKALLTGDRSGLGKDLTGIFQDSGASHILALSGLHLGVLYVILAKATAPLGNSPVGRRLRYSLIILTAFFYCAMTGASPSIIRAFLFITINETCRLTGRKRKPVRVLLAALTIQLALRPEVISSVGFQLSYMAMAGIFLLYPTLERIYPAAEKSVWSRIDPFRKVWNAAMLSVSCQAFTGPVAWYYFQAFPKYFILTNLIALPLTSAIMVLSVATISLTFLGICPEPLVILNDQAIQTLVFCLKVISGLDES